MNPCNHKLHKLKWYDWMKWVEELDKRGIHQTQCPKCKLWLFPEEVNKKVKS